MARRSSLAGGSANKRASPPAGTARRAGPHTTRRPAWPWRSRSGSGVGASARHLRLSLWRTSRPGQRGQERRQGLGTAAAVFSDRAGRASTRRPAQPKRRAHSHSAVRRSSLLTTRRDQRCCPAVTLPGSKPGGLGGNRGGGSSGVGPTPSRGGAAAADGRKTTTGAGLQHPGHTPGTSPRRCRTSPSTWPIVESTALTCLGYHMCKRGDTPRISERGWQVSRIDCIDRAPIKMQRTDVASRMPLTLTNGDRTSRRVYDVSTDSWMHNSITHRPVQMNKNVDERRRYNTCMGHSGRYSVKVDPETVWKWVLPEGTMTHELR